MANSEPKPCRPEAAASCQRDCKGNFYYCGTYWRSGTSWCARMASALRRLGRAEEAEAGAEEVRTRPRRWARTRRGRLPARGAPLAVLVPRSVLVPPPQARRPRTPLGTRQAPGHQAALSEPGRRALPPARPLPPSQALQKAVTRLRHQKGCPSRTGRSGRPNSRRARAP